jgi:hypothetical protein
MNRRNRLTPWIASRLRGRCRNFEGRGLLSSLRATGLARMRARRRAQLRSHGNDRFREAIRFFAEQRKNGLLPPSLFAMTWRVSRFNFQTARQMRVRIPAARFARGCAITFRPKVRGRRECRVPASTRGLVCKVHSRMRTRAYRYSRSSPAFPAQWFDGLCRALPGDEFVLPPSPAN